MSELKVGDRVVIHKGLFGSGVVKDITHGLYTVKCDKKLPNEYAWETDTSLFFAKDLELENTNKE